MYVYIIYGNQWNRHKIEMDLFDLENPYISYGLQDFTAVFEVLYISNGKQWNQRENRNGHYHK